MSLLPVMEAEGSLCPYPQGGGTECWRAVVLCHATSMVLLLIAVATRFVQSSFPDRTWRFFLKKIQKNLNADNTVTDSR